MWWAVGTADFTPLPSIYVLAPETISMSGIVQDAFIAQTVALLLNTSKGQQFERSTHLPSCLTLKYHGQCVVNDSGWEGSCCDCPPHELRSAGRSFPADLSLFLELSLTIRFHVATLPNQPFLCRAARIIYVFRTMPWMKVAPEICSNMNDFQLILLKTGISNPMINLIRMLD
jgi:hypothetical protein